MNSRNQAYLPESLSLSSQQSFNNETFLGLLDIHFPLNEGSHREVSQYRVYFGSLVAHLKSGRCVGLLNPSEFREFDGDRECPSSITLKNTEQQIALNL